MRPELSIIIVNYKSQRLIADCLQSIEQNSSTANLEIIIVDNSNDDPQMLRDRFPGIRWMPMGYNSGFARANNAGMKVAQSEIMLLLNPDILVEDDAIQ